MTDVTPDRWDPAVYCDAEQAGPAHFYTRRGGFLGELATSTRFRSGSCLLLLTERSRISC